MRSLWHSIIRGPLYGFAGLAVTLAMGIAADYGIGPVQAEPSSLPGATSASARAPAPEPASAQSLPAKDTPTRAAPDLTANQASTAFVPTIVGSDPGAGRVRLPGHVLDALAVAVPAISESSNEAALKDSMTLTLVFKRDHAPQFERYMRAVYDPNSKRYQHYLTPTQIADRFGPSRRAYEQALGYLRGQGFKLVERSKNRETLTVSAKRAQVQQTLALDIRNYKIGDATFFANTADPALPKGIASHVLAISGLANYGQPRNSGMFVAAACVALIGWAYIGLTFGTAGAGSFVLYYLVASAGGGALVGAFCAGLGYLANQGYLWAFPPTTPPPTTQPNPPVNNSNCGSAGSWGSYSGCNGQLNPQPQGQQVENSLRAGSRAAAFSLPRPAPGVAGATGAGQTIGLLEFDGFNPQDVKDFLTLVGAPSTTFANLSEVPVNGGVTTPGSNQDEVLLDIDTAMTIAHDAKIVVYDAPFNGQATSYSALFNAMINHGVTIISNSWASCEDQVSAADAAGIDAVLQTAAASGISVFNGTGDHGGACLDGAQSTVSVPADSPNATAVGGSSLTMGPGFTYGTETWWDGAASVPQTGQGGFGISKYFARPGYQAGLNASAMRSLPDVVINADPTSGMVICQASAGGCPTGLLYGGTSMSAPAWAAYAAVINQSQGKNLGAYNPRLYPLSNTAAFHSATSMSSDFSHVGLGSPNIGKINLALSGQSVGLPDQSRSGAVALGPTSSILVGVGSIAADGASTGGLLVYLHDAAGHAVDGKAVTITANGGGATVSPSSAVTTDSNGTAVFTITDQTPETVTYTVRDVTDGVQLSQTAAIHFSVPPAASAGISANPSSVPADGQTAATIIVTLKDSLNRPTPGKTISVSDGGAHAVITGPTPAVTDANGQIQFSATDQVNETVTFTAIDVSDNNLAVPGSGAVTYSGSVNTACGVGVAPTAATGYTISSYSSGFPAAPLLFYGNANLHCPGANNPAFTSSGAVLISDFLNGGIYQVGLSGGLVSTTNLISTLTPALGGLVYGKDGSLYASLGGEAGEIIEVDPANGTQLRVVASGLTCPAGLAVDPLSGDLFFDDQCTGGGSDNASIYRIIDPANTDAGKPTSVVVYATLPTTPNGGMAFAPNGTLYAVSGYYLSQTAPVEQISATSSATVTVTTVAGVTSDYAVAIGATNPDGSAQSLIAEPSGNLTEIPIGSPGAAVVLATGSPGVGVTGPDGCLYSAHYDTVYRLANSTGNCTFAPTSPAPALNLTPIAITPNPAQGSTQTLTAKLHNVSTLAGVPVFFAVKGANAQIKMVDTDADGNAILKYTAIQAGNDTVTASTTANDTALTSNTVKLAWTAGKHVTFLSLNSSPEEGTISHAVNVVASLSDVSASPAAAISGQTVTLSLDGSSCTAITGSSGNATCALTPSQSGTGTLTAGFAGNGRFVASTTSVGFNVIGPPTSAPTVAISVNPKTVAAGASATLTWSSTNTTACTASGSWSGSEPTSGTQSVTPAANGTYTYTLTCTGAGGSSAASVVLSASLVAVTVTARSGGGSFSGWLSLFLSLLVLLRLGAIMRVGDGPFSKMLVSALLVFAGTVPAHADQSMTEGSVSPSNQSGSWVDPLYIGIRVGGMPVHLDSSKLDQGLAALGYSGVNSSTGESAIGGTAYIGYEFNPVAGVEFGYTHRSSTTTSLNGTVPSTANIVPLLRDTAELIRGYGNLFSLSYRGRFELAPGFSVDPRFGAFFWDTKVTAESGSSSVDVTHQGGGVTAGVGLAYRVWRGLELGLGVDYFRGSPHNIASLYGGSLEWRFGH
jgi:Pro-kumamolisin, activation domain/Bacterial Ig-like domain (group 1)/OmpA-like transmembrane domain